MTSCHLCGLAFAVDDAGRKLKSVKSFSLFKSRSKDEVPADRLKNIGINVRANTKDKDCICAKCYNGIKVQEQANSLANTWRTNGNINTERVNDDAPATKKTCVERVSSIYLKTPELFSRKTLNSEIPNFNSVRDNFLRIYNSAQLAFFSKLGQQRRSY